MTAYDKNHHACYLLEYHLVMATKYRHDVLVDEIEIKLKELSYIIFETYWDCKIEAIECDKNHIHIMFKTYPQIQLTKLINNYKTVTSKILRRDFYNKLRPYYWKNVFWSRSYFICSVGENTKSVVEEYIRNQKLSH